MPHISSFNFEDLQEVMKHAPKVRSWSGLLKYMMDNDAYKGRHEGNALPGLIQAVNKLKDGGETFSKDPRELWEKINSRPSDIKDEDDHAPLRGRELEESYSDTGRAEEGFPRKELNSFDDSIGGSARPAVPFASGMGEGLPGQRENTAQDERRFEISGAGAKIKRFARRASSWRPPAKGLLAAAGIAGLTFAGIMSRRAGRSKQGAPR